MRRWGEELWGVVSGGGGCRVGTRELRLGERKGRGQWYPFNDLTVPVMSYA